MDLMMFEHKKVNCSGRHSISKTKKRSSDEIFTFLNQQLDPCDCKFFANVPFSPTPPPVCVK